MSDNPNPNKQTITFKIKLGIFGHFFDNNMNTEQIRNPPLLYLYENHIYLSYDIREMRYISFADILRNIK